MTKDDINTLIQESSDDEVVMEFTDEKPAGIVETAPAATNGIANGAVVEDEDIDDI